MQYATTDQLALVFLHFMDSVQISWTVFNFFTYELHEIICFLLTTHVDGIGRRIWTYHIIRIIPTNWVQLARIKM